MMLNTKPRYTVVFGDGDDVRVDAINADETSMRRAAVALLNAAARKSEMGFEAFIDYVADAARQARPK